MNANIITLESAIAREMAIATPGTWMYAEVERWREALAAGYRYVVGLRRGVSPVNGPQVDAMNMSANLLPFARPNACAVRCVEDAEALLNFDERKDVTAARSYVSPGARDIIRESRELDRQDTALLAAGYTAEEIEAADRDGRIDDFGNISDCD